MGLTFRDQKGTPLTFSELDNNFSYFTGSYINTGTISGSFEGNGDKLVINKQRIFETTSSFSTSDLIDGRTQEGASILVDNGSNNIQITCSGDISANYQKLGTGKITFVAGTGRTLETPQGNVLNYQYEAANLAFSASKDILIKGGGVFFF